MKKYQLRERTTPETRAALANYSELLQDLLSARNIFERDAAAQFINPDFERDSHDPFLLPDMDKAVERVLAARRLNEPVAVWSDYDCDGIPGGVLLTEFLRSIGLVVRHYIPHRHKEGYGLNLPGLDELHAQGIKLVLTVDLGTTNHQEILYAQKKGMDVIVTDHHIVSGDYVASEITSEKVLGSPPSGRPDHFLQQFPTALEASFASFSPAYALINPKRPDSQYLFDGLCGAGVAWKLVQGVLQKMRESGQPFDYAEGREKWLLDLVGLGTLSDMVPLVGENRMLARYGLLVMRRNRRPGLASLLSLLRIKPGSLVEDDIGFMIAPRINAASRMDSPELAARLLATADVLEAKELAKQLNGINDERKGLVASIVKETNKRLALMEHTDPVLVMGNPNWRPGVLGLVANSLAQAHNKPVFLWGREGGELLRGSCRSDGRINIVELMHKAAEVFDHFGGHAASGGFSLLEERVHELGPRLNEAFATLEGSATQDTEIIIDRELELAEIAHAHRELAHLAPFGVDNAKPLFLFPNVAVSSVRMFGKKTDHLELGFSRDGVRNSGVAFFSTVDSFQKPVIEGMKADVVGHVETDWNGRPRLRVVDIL